MKNRLLPAIDIEVKPSHLLLGALSTISILSCLAISILPMLFLIQLLMMAVIIFSSLYYILRDALLLLPWSWQRIEVTSVGQLRLTNKLGQQFAPVLDATSFIHPLLIILNVKKPRTMQQIPAVILLAESTCPQRRQLRVWLRWWKHEGAEKILA